MQKWPYQRLTTLIIMIPLVSFYSFALDLYIPLLPTIQHDLQATRVVMQYTNSLFMFACGIGQLVFGPISDRCGRRPILFASCITFVLANLICANAGDVSILLAGRILQAIGACGCYLVSFATIRDIYPDDNASAEMFSYLNIANSLSAIFAPYLGSIIGSYLTWHAIFYLQTCSSLLTLIMCFALFTETTSSTSGKGMSLTTVFWNYVTIFCHVNYHAFTLPAAVGMGSFFAYYSVSPYLYQEVLGFDASTFGILYGTCGVTFFIGSYICGLCVARFGILHSLYIGLSFHTVGCIGVLASHWLSQTLSVLPFHTSMILIILGASFMIGAGIGGTMAPFAKMAGAAFAMISCYKFLLSDLTGDIVMHFYTNSPASLGYSLLSLNLIAWLVLLGLRKKLVSGREDPSAKLARAMDLPQDQIL